MDHFAKQTAEERATYFQEAAARMNLPAHIIEKDFWVCWTLKRLFELTSIQGDLLFKGGTSLSKVHRLIRRFSEDVDLSIHRESLGFSGDTDPANPNLSNKARKRTSAALTQTAQKKVMEEIFPELQEIILQQLTTRNWVLEADSSDPDGLSLAFIYPATSCTMGDGAYLKSAVKIEFGARSDHWPAEEKQIIPYLSEAIPEALDEPKTSLKVMCATRTFWEKATILHQTAHLPENKPFPQRYSRHYCDLAEMIKAGVGDEAAKDKTLLEAVVNHKIAFYRSAWANYETAQKGSLCLIPAIKQLPALEQDLKSMTEMFFDTPPEFSEVIETLESWQNKFNG
jgi:hypothetical protein